MKVLKLNKKTTQTAETDANLELTSSKAKAKKMNQQEQHWNVTKAR